MKKYLLCLFTEIFIVSMAVAQQWAIRYSGPGKGMDEIKAMVVDKSGNVYVTGYVYNGVASDNDYVTIKYNSSGAQQWLAKYNGPGSGSDVPGSIYVDNAGFVYVTGTSDGLTGTYIDYDVATVKYNPSGGEVWSRRYAGASARADAGNSIRVDAGGNVVIAGYSTVRVLGQKKVFLTIKYNSAGTQQWLQTFQGIGRTNGQDDAAIGCSLDATGNVFVTGYVFAGTGYSGRIDYMTIKYNAAGIRQWTQQYDGPSKSFDYPTGIATDGSGNVIITGYSMGSGLDFATIKYNTQGVQQWLARYDGPIHGSDIAHAVAVDNAGNVYVTGSDQKTAYNSDFLTAKYNAAGTLQWTARYQGSANDNDEALALALDKSGNVFVTGYINGVSPSWDIATIKYNGAGVQQWANKFNGPKDSADVGNAIGVDDLGNVYVAGASTGKTTAYDYITLKYPATASRGVPGEEIPATKFTLLQNYPNPFRVSTDIYFTLPDNGGGDRPVKLVIYDRLGRFVDMPVNGLLNGGEHRITWIPGTIPSGTYYYKLLSEGLEARKSMVRIK